MTYEIREYVVGDWTEDYEEKLDHVWFQVKNLDEAMAAILKRVFGRDVLVHRGINEWTGTSYWVHDNLGLYEVYGSEMMKFELDNIMGPSTERRYVIERVA